MYLLEVRITYFDICTCLFLVVFCVFHPPLCSLYLASNRSTQTVREKKVSKCGTLILLVSFAIVLPSSKPRTTHVRLRAAVPRAKVLRGYLETVSELPWNRLSEETYDIRRAQLQLDKDHHGLDKVGSAMCAFCVVCALALLVFFCVCAFFLSRPRVVGFFVLVFVC